MVGHVKRFRPNVSDQLIQDWLTARVRQALDARTYWSDLIIQKVLSVPAAYSTGTIALTTGSTTVTGTGTAWATNDVVNTTLSSAVEEIGYATATPASMSGIEIGKPLYIDAGGTPEVVVPVEVNSVSFKALFTMTHAAAQTVTASSHAGRQLRVSNATPVFTVQAVVSATSLIIDNPWGDEDVTAQTYNIMQLYFILAHDLKEILWMVDKQVGRPLRVHAPVTEANWRDPQRSSTGDPQALIDFGPNSAGDMLYELWPRQTGARQLPYAYYKQWPEMTKDNDRPPWFINPTIFVHGAIADALRFRNTDDRDRYHNPTLADHYEQRFLVGLEDAKNNDESKMQSAYGFDYRQVFGAGGANFWQSHDPDLHGFYM
jgi:hypothetical protein